jgi:hypothetical protein
VRSSSFLCSRRTAKHALHRHYRRRHTSVRVPSVHYGCFCTVWQCATNARTRSEEFCQIRTPSLATMALLTTAQRRQQRRSCRHFRGRVSCGFVLTTTTTIVRATVRCNSQAASTLCLPLI